eukprot:925532_1
MLRTLTEQKQNANGFVEWKVTGNLLQQFKNAKHKQVFYSPPFETIDGTIWRIIFYPRGNQSPDDCSIYLECVELNALNPRMGVSYSFNIAELNWWFDDGATFTNDAQTCGYSKAFKTETLNNLAGMSIECFVSEVMDVRDGTTNAYFEWKINQHWMQRWKNTEYKHAFYSPTFNAIGAEWLLRIYPNGWGTEGEAELSIHCASIESDQKEINFSHCIEIESMNHWQAHFDGNSIEKGGWLICNAPFKWNDIQNESETTICVKIWKTGSIEKNEAKLVFNIYSDKMMKIRKECSEAIQNAQNQIQSLKRKNKTIATRDLKKEQQLINLRKEAEHLRNVAMREIK